ncbi:hypothetical protein ACKFKG_32135 [Phormidesmis sp. 146-35]
MILAKTVNFNQFQYIPEWDDEFLSLFLHRYDYIWAEHPDPKGKVEWKTESRHPLSDRLIHQGAFLYGVRFGAETQYCLLDIDVGSIYHPKRDPFAISRILAELEPLGLVSYIACTSSYSGGIHLYFPFEQPQKTWELSLALQAVLENGGLKPALGQLELFPNVRLFVTEGTPNLYAAHRLPMQAGSYILSDDWELTNSNQATFVQQWRFAQRRNDINAKILQRVLKAARRKRYCLSGKADKFLNDLNADIEAGWSGSGQTNYLLGRIAMRSYIFGHLLYGCEPLAGKALVNDIVRLAKSLPGYEEWCRHQSEIEHRAEEWAQCVEASHYFPFGQSKQAPTELITATAEEVLTWNQQRSQAARERIRQAIADLLNKSILPVNATARFHALTSYGIGGGSLYRHRDLWHPAHLVENPPDPPNTLKVSSIDCAGGASIEKSLTSLLSKNDGNRLTSNSFKDSLGADHSLTDGNRLLDKEVSEFVSADSPSYSPDQQGELEGIRYVQQILFEIQEQSQADREAAKQTPIQGKLCKREEAKAAQIQRMQQYWDSGDPILMAEAQQWASSNPGILNIPEPPDQPQQRGTEGLADLPMGKALLRQVEHLARLAIGLGEFEQETAEPIDEESLEVADFSDVLAQISVHRQRLGWTTVQVREALNHRFDKTSQAMLTDSELMEWLSWWGLGRSLS